LTSEQLQNARAERWRQASNPILTSDDAEAWLNGIGLCLFLPRTTHFSGTGFAPAPSFVEAVAGLPSEAPSREAIEAATALLHRLTVAGTVLPLNLFGAVGGSVSDQPDFVVTREALPYVFSLIGGRNWKSGPGTKASPLVLEIWKQLDGADAQTAAEIQTALGREVTEAAVLRGLVELWNGLRAIPVYDGETTHWELTQARFAVEMTASQKVAQTTALSALVSLYLESVIAASTEEIETFLSPLTARSRVHEAVNGLSATRQLGLVSVAATPLLHVAGSLPEFAEAEPVEVELRPRTASFERKPRVARDGGAERKPYERGTRSGDRRGEDRGSSGPVRDRGPRERSGPPRERTGPPRERTGFGRSGPGRSDAGRFAARGDAPFRPKSDGERPYRKPDGRKQYGGERKSFDKKPFDKPAKPFGARSSDRPRPFDRERPSPGGGKFAPKKFGRGGERPWQDRGAGRGSDRETRGERPYRPRGEDTGRPSRPSFDRPRPYSARPDRPSGDRPRPYPSGERRAGKFGGEKKFGEPKKFGAPKFGGPKFGGRGDSGPRAGSRPPGSRSAGSGRPSFSGGFKREKPGEKRPFFRERPAKAADGESRPRTFRADSGAAPAKRAGGWKPKLSGGGFSKTGKPAFGKSGKPAFKSGGKPGFKKAGFSKPGFGKSAKPFEKSAKPFGKSGKPAFGKTKPGGFKPPFRKRKDEGSKNAE
jgi:hypothetical protein